MVQPLKNFLKMEDSMDVPPKIKQELIYNTTISLQGIYPTKKFKRGTQTDT